MTLLERAQSVANLAHDTQKRKGLDVAYITHPLRVFVAARSIGLSEEAQAAALLHDVVEDTKLTF